MSARTGVERYCLGRHGTIRHALEVIDRMGIGMAVVVDEDRRVLGVVSDGDVRRALLAGHRLEDPIEPHIRKDFLRVRPESTRAEVLDLMRARVIHQVPVINEHGHMVGIHTLQRILGATERPNWAVIMAGGQGMRLRPITERIPKPMIPVAGRPILERLVLHLVGHGVQRVFLAVNYKADMIESHFGDGADFGCRIEYLRESAPMGSGGAVALLPSPPEHAVVVLNGDLVTQVDIASMVEEHEQSACYATMGVRPFEQRLPFGCVETDDGGFIRAVEEKPSFQRLVNAGVYVLSPRAVADVPARFFPITDLFTAALEKAERCGTYLIESDWIDVGRHDQLDEARNGQREEHGV